MSIDTQILLIAFSYNPEEGCEDYLNLVIETYTKLAREPEKIEYIIGINSKGINIGKLKLHNNLCNIKLVDIQLEEGEKNIFEDQVRKKPNTIRSRCHGDALNKLFNYVTTKYFMTVDSDCFCIKKDWDIEIKNMLKDNIIIAGSGHHYSLMRYRDFPAIYSSIYLTEKWKEIGIDFSFNNDKNFMREIKHKDKNLYHLLKVPLKNRLTSDTGSKLPYIARINGFEGTEFKSLRLNKPVDKPKKFLNNIKLEKSDWIKKTEEYHYDGEVYFVHLSGGRNRNSKEDLFSIKFIQCIKNYIKKMYNISVIS